MEQAAAVSRIRALPSLVLVGAVLVCAVLAAVSPPILTLRLGLAVLATLVLLLAWFEARQGAPMHHIEVVRELPGILSVGRPAEVVLRVAWRGSVGIVVTPADGVPAALGAEAAPRNLRIAAGGAGELRYPILPVLRGEHPFEPLWLRVRLPWSLVEHRVLLDLPAVARVGPDLQNLRDHGLRARRDLLAAHGGRRTRLAGRDGDFERLREFVSGDDLRHVDWKATARAGRPMVRVFQAERAQNIVILVDGTRLMGGRSGAVAKIDHAIDAALALSWVAIQHGDRVAACVFDEKARVFVPPGTGPAHLGRIRRALQYEQAAPAFPRYGEAAAFVARHLRRRSLLVWLTDLMDGEQSRELLAALTALRGRHLNLVLAMEDRELLDLARADPTDEAAMFARVAAMEAEDERDTLLRRLRRQGAQVHARRPDEAASVIVDRYLDVKQRGAL